MEAKVRAYAASLVKQYDKNGNGVLDKDEWGQMRGDPKAADRNADGVITVDELAARLVDYSRGRSARHSSGSPPTGGSSSAPVPGSGGKPGLRFLSPQERLPEGLPDWFRDKDKDGDGQIRMAEFAHAWSDAIAAEFAKHDLNGDGIITPQECLQALKAQ